MIRVSPAVIAVSVCAVLSWTDLLADTREVTVCRDGVEYLCSVETEGRRTVARVGDGSATSIDLETWRSLTLPDRVMDWPVTEIADYAFDGCEYVRSVRMPETVTTIGYCAFAGCWRLQDVNLPDGLRSICDEAFYGSGITDLVLPRTVDQLGWDVFGECRNLESISIPSRSALCGQWFSLPYLEDNARTFIGWCMTEDGSGDWVQYDEGFDSCGFMVADDAVTCYALWLPGYWEWDYDEEEDGIVVRTVEGAGASVVIPEKIDGCRVSGVSGSLYGGESLTNLSVGSSVKFVSTDFLYDCTNLERLQIAGADSSRLVRVGSIRSMDDEWSYVGRRTFLGWNTRADGSGQWAVAADDSEYGDKIEVGPEGLVLYPQWADGLWSFWTECADAFDVVTGDWCDRPVKAYIEGYSAPWDDGLSVDVTVPACWHGIPIKGVEDWIFEEMPNIRSLVFPAGLSGLTVRLEGCPDRYGWCFAGWCTAADGSGTWYSDYCGRGEAVRFAVPAGGLTLYPQWVADRWSWDVLWNDGEESPYGIVVTGYSCWWGYADEEGYEWEEYDPDIVIPETICGLPVLELGGFRCEEGATTLTIPASVVSVWGLENAPSSTDIADGLVYVGGWLVGWTGSLPPTVTVAAGTRGIAESALAGSDITSVSLPEGLTQIGALAFENCANLISVTLPTTVTDIGYGAFAGTAAAAAALDRHVPLYLGKWLCGLEGVSNQTEIVVVNGTRGVADGVLECSLLERLTLPTSLRSFGDSYNETLRALALPAGCERASVSGLVGLRSLSVKSSSALVGKRLLLPYAWEDESWALQGWNTAADGTGKWVEGMGWTVPSTDGTLYPCFYDSRIACSGIWDDEDRLLGFEICDFDAPQEAARNVTLPSHVDGYAVIGITGLGTNRFPSVSVPSTVHYVSDALWDNFEPSSDGLIYAGNWLVGYDSERLSESVDVRGLSSVTEVWTNSWWNGSAMVTSVYTNVNQVVDCLRVRDGTVGISDCALSCLCVRRIEIPASVSSVGWGVFDGAGEYLRELDFAAGTKLAGSEIQLGDCYPWDSSEETTFSGWNTKADGTGVWCHGDLEPSDDWNECLLKVPLSGGAVHAVMRKGFWGYRVTRTCEDPDGCVVICGYEGGERELVIPSEAFGLPVRAVEDLCLDGVGCLTVPSSVAGSVLYLPCASDGVVNGFGETLHCVGWASATGSPAAYDIGDGAWLTVPASGVTLVPQYVSADIQWDFMYDDWSGNPNGIVVYDYTGSRNSLEIPETICGLPVRRLEGFGSAGALASVQIPTSVTSVGEGSFRGTAVYEKAATNALVRIDNWVVGFKGDPADLTGDVIVPEGIIGISEDTFCGCGNLRSLTLPSTLRHFDGLQVAGGSFDVMTFKAGAMADEDVSLGTDFWRPDAGFIGWCTTANGRGTGYIDSEGDGFVSVRVPSEGASFHTAWMRDGWSWDFVTEDGSDRPCGFEISGWSGVETSVAVPDYVCGLPVTALFGGSWRETLASVSIPATVSFVEAGAFDGTDLLKGQEGPVYAGAWLVGWNEITNEIHRVDLDVSAGAESGLLVVDRLEVREGTVGIVDWALSGVDVRRLTLPSSLDFMGEGVLADCPAVTEVTVKGSPRTDRCLWVGLPWMGADDGLTFIGWNTAEDGSGLWASGSEGVDSEFFEIAVSDETVRLVPVMLSGVWEFENITSDDDDEEICWRCCGGDEDLRGLRLVFIEMGTSQNGPLVIPSHAFGLAVESIAEYAVGGGQGVTGVTIPGTVRRIDGAAFADCPRLTNFTFTTSSDPRIIRLPILETDGRVVQGGWLSEETGERFFERDEAADGVLVTIPAAGGRYRPFWMDELAGAGYEWEWNETGITVLGASDEYAVELIIPAAFDGVPVTRVSGFNDRQWLSKLVIPPTVMRLFDCFQSCPNLTYVSLPQHLVGMTDDDYVPFADCENIREVTITPSEYGWTFSPKGWCGFVSIGCCDDWEYDSNSLFETFPSATWSLERLVIAEGIESVPQRLCRRSWNYCSDDETGFWPYLQDITLPQSLKEMDSGAFDGTAAYWDARETSANGVVYLDGWAVGYSSSDDGRGRTVTIQEGIRGIANSCFNCAEDVYAVELPDSLAYVGEDAFSECPVRLVRFGAGTKVIGSSAFFGCSRLTSVSFDRCEAVEIGRNAFAACPSLTSLRLSAGVKSVGPGAFSAVYVCDDWDGYYFDESWGDEWNGSMGLRELVIDEGVTAIGFGAFAGNELLREVILPASLRKIEDAIFSGCALLDAVTFLGDVPEQIRDYSVDDFDEACCVEQVHYDETSDAWYVLRQPELYLGTSATLVTYVTRGSLGWNGEASSDLPEAWPLGSYDQRAIMHLGDAGAAIKLIDLGIYPVGAGTVTGGGYYREGTNVRLQTVAAPGYEFLGWAEQTEANGYRVMSVYPQITLSVSNDVAAVALYAALSSDPPSGPGEDDDPPSQPEDPPQLFDALVFGNLCEKGAAYSGFVGGDALGGTFTLVVGKPKKGASTAKVTLTLVDAATGKKIKKTGVVDLASGVCTGELEGLKLGANSVSGSLAGEPVQGAADAAKMKDADALAVLHAFNKRSYALVSDDASGERAYLTVTFAAKGKAKVAGSFRGAKVSGSVQMSVGDTLCAVPFAWSKKGVSATFVLWFDRSTRTLVDVTGLGAGATLVAAGSADTMANGDYTFVMNEADIRATVPDAIAETFMPISLSLNGKKFDAGKAAKVSYKKGELAVDTSKGGNVTGLTLKCSKGTLTGSFTIYAVANSKLVKNKFTVSGVIVGESGYATATNKKLGSFPVRISRR